MMMRCLIRFLAGRGLGLSEGIMGLRRLDWCGNEVEKIMGMRNFNRFL